MNERFAGSSPSLLLASLLMCTWTRATRHCYRYVCMLYMSIHTALMRPRPAHSIEALTPHQMTSTTPRLPLSTSRINTAETQDKRTCMNQHSNHIFSTNLSMILATALRTSFDSSDIASHN
ncbi:hypothetical protein BU25DRAFT_449282 [Macroventuria anomochaeta]|uniref:Uncharacterized protein n=1 Tax=Macroventuria anomochaeta TaxID=301207 RepID=A0ACB6RW93_9PLEO|nr:uncharacterized protein BU25DRAFT_449282 [Macroventuria anomochaeta]KAF2626285.1 hypothetical protein BU25DRAFT_449282 [Macroventuria anomochaeta]